MDISFLMNSEILFSRTMLVLPFLAQTSQSLLTTFFITLLTIDETLPPESAFLPGIAFPRIDGFYIQGVT